MKSTDTTPHILEAKMHFGKAFAEAKKTNADLSEYQEWTIYEHNMQNSRIKCEQCGTVNRCNIDMNFSHYCGGTMKWKNQEILCWATHQFSDHTYKITQYEMKQLRQICFEKNGGDCGRIACCKIGHKDHNFQKVNKKRGAWLTTIGECENCGTIKTTPNDRKALEDKLFELFVDQYVSYWDQYGHRTSEFTAQANTNRQRAIHEEIKGMIMGGDMIVQRALDHAENRLRSNFRGSFRDVVLHETDRKEALAKIHDYAIKAVEYIMKKK